VVANKNAKHGTQSIMISFWISACNLNVDSLGFLFTFLSSSTFSVNSFELYFFTFFAGLLFAFLPDYFARLYSFHWRLLEI